VVRKYKRYGIPKAYHVYQPITEQYFYTRTRICSGNPPLVFSQSKENAAGYGFFEFCVAAGMAHGVCL